MAQAIDYEQMVRNVLENAVSEVETGPRIIAVSLEDINAGLNRICTRLHDHDGWADWREINASVFQAAVKAYSHRRKPIWNSVRQAVACWGETNAVNLNHARV